MHNTTYYDILEVPPTATEDDIRRRYRECLLRFRQLAGSAQAPDASELDRLRTAFEVLTDPARRVAYDASLNTADAPPPLAPPPDTPEDRAADRAAASHGFRFIGEGSAYFRIWIVNLCLSIVTLGIYSAWAKVRREQYFHRNLLLNDSGFDYHGKPVAILKGRAIAFGLFILLSVMQQAGPLMYVLALIGIGLAAPALAIAALRFRAANTSYRGLRFSFEASYGTAFKVIVLNGLATLLTLGLWFPKLVRDWRKFVVDHSRFGEAGFSCNLAVGTVYRIFLLPLAMLVGIVAASALLGPQAVMVSGGLLVFAFYLIFPSYVMGRMTNAVWSSTQLAEHRFESAIPMGRYVGVALANAVLIVLTLGLFIPWAYVRMARLRADYLTLHAAGSLDDFVARQSTEVSALGDGAADVFSMDLAL